MKLSEKNRKILLVNLHKLIEENANTIANHIQHNRLKQLIIYPPNGGLTESEKNELRKISGNEELKSALRKVLANATADVFFNFLNILDGTGDPEIDSREWTEVALIDYPENYEETEMLHDEFFATYWDWREKRKNTNWKLDLFEG